MRPVSRDSKGIGEKRLPLLNRISGGSVDPYAEAAAVEERLSELISGSESHYEEIQKWAEAEGIDLDPVTAGIGRERRLLEDRAMPTEKAEEQSLRKLLHGIGVLSNRVDSETRSAIQKTLKPIFKEKREANLFFHNRQGALYRNPYSTSRHEAFGINLDEARSIDWMLELESLIKLGYQRISADNFRGWVHLTSFVRSQRLSSLSCDVPGSVAEMHVDPQILGMPAPLQRALKAGSVSSTLMRKAFNYYTSSISGMMFAVCRSGFIVRCKFQREDSKTVIYVPKDRGWNPPPQLFKSEKPIGEALRSFEPVFDESGAIDPVQTLSKLTKEKKKGPDLNAYLQQSPHDWYFPMSVRAELEEVLGRAMKGKTSQLQSNLRPSRSLRLSGPSSMLSKLDRTLVDPSIKLGDAILLFDQSFGQSLSFDKGRPKLEIAPQKLKVEAAIPFVDSSTSESSQPIWDRIVAIDLGEHSIAYAVFDIPSYLETGELVPILEDGEDVVGTVSVPSIRRLMKAVRAHRTQGQPNQKMRDRYSRLLEQRRENVVGDVCNRIENLMHRYSAFPVLEREVERFEIGSNQLRLVYGSVIRRYAFSMVDAHKQVRRQHWANTDLWRHPYLEAFEYDEEGATLSKTKAKVLSLFPGTTVSAAFTSQICHQCERSPLVALRALSDRVEVKEGGRIEVSDGVIALFEKADYTEDEFRLMRRRKERAELNVPVGSGRMPAKRLIRIARRNLRRPPKSLMSPDTTQSRYCCVYEDCGFEGHSDMNAAINIGRRFLGERIHRDKSMENWQDYRDGKEA